MDSVDQDSAVTYFQKLLISKNILFLIVKACENFLLENFLCKEAIGMLQKIICLPSFIVHIHYLTVGILITTNKMECYAMHF